MDRSMKKILPLIFALLFPCLGRAADGTPLFNAVFSMGKETRFILVSPAGKTSDWVRLGDTFEGYTLKSFDPAKSELAVEHNGAVSKLRLVADAAVKDAPALAATAATLADAEHVLQVMRFEDMMEKMLAQQKKQSLAMIKQMSSRMEQPGVNKEDLAAFQQKMMDEIMSVMNAGELKKDMAQIYSDVFSKEELAAQAAFYLTPAGRAMVDKTPDVQSRLQAVMMPRMQAMMPKIAQMGQQFQLEQKAKAQAAAPAPTAGTVAPAPTAPAPTR